MKHLPPGLKILQLLTVIGFVHLLGIGLLSADQYLPLLQTKTATYSNVTVTLKTPGGIHIRHSRGIGNVELEDLDKETQALLGYAVGTNAISESDESTFSFSEGWLDTMAARVRSGAGTGRMPMDIPMTLSPAWIAIVLFAGLLFHLFFSYCGRLICIKAGSDPGLLIWLPMLQVLPFFRAAGMSYWWLLGLFVPLLNFVVQILWCFKIVSARGKHVIWAVLFLLPLVNIVAFLYLAFSGDDSSSGTVGMGSLSPNPV